MNTSRAVITAALTGLLALTLGACSGSSPAGSTSGDHTSAGPGPTRGAQPTYVLATSSPARTGAAVTPAPAPDVGPSTSPTSVAPADLRYVKIREPFSRPGECVDDGSTLEMTACVLEQVIDVDSTIDALQVKRFERARVSQRPGILVEYARWLKDRTRDCAAGGSGGSIDQINAAQCLLKASQERVETLNDVG